MAALKELARVATGEGEIAVGLWATPDKVDFRVVFGAVRDALPEPPRGAGPFELSTPGTLEALIERAGMSVSSADEADCPFIYPDSETFWKANVSAGPLQAVKGKVAEDVLKSAVLEAVEPYRTAHGGLRFENVFRYVTAQPKA